MTEIDEVLRRQPGAATIIDANGAAVGSTIDVHYHEGQPAAQDWLDELGLLHATEDEGVDECVPDPPTARIVDARNEGQAAPCSAQTLAIPERKSHM